MRQSSALAVSYPTSLAGNSATGTTKLMKRYESPSVALMSVTVESRPGASRPARATPRGAVARPRPPTRSTLLLAVFLLVVLFLLSSIGMPGAGRASPVARSNVAASASSPSAPNSLRTESPVTPPAASSHPDTLPCYNLNETVCVSVQNASIPDIIPQPGSHVSIVHPSSNTTISLYVESEFPLTWLTAKTYGPHSPLSLNATGTLWNGVPFYSLADGTQWREPGTTWWTTGPPHQNTSYPYWYGLNFSTHSAVGTPNFFPGMELSWWVYFVSNNSGVYTHWSSVALNFTFSGAWPYSPYPSAPHPSLGGGAARQDLSVHQTPAQPNFNDTVNLTIMTTPVDLTTGATIGAAYLDVTETAPDGLLLAQTSFKFPVSLTGSVGAIESWVVLPPAFAHNPGALVQYTVTASDTNTWGPDTIQTQSFNYTVNGNGSFVFHSFDNDLAFSTTPVGPGLGGFPPALVAAGTPVSVLLQSKVSTTAIFSASLVVTFSYGAVNETSVQDVALVRVNSTAFSGTIPGMPLGAVVTFQVLAFDFSQDRDISPVYSFATPTLSAILPSVPTNSTFFVMYVYDNGTAQWVSGASVQIRGLAGASYIRTNGTTYGGVAYPNQTGRAFVPQLLPAGSVYNIWVNDSAFRPSGDLNAPSVEFTLTAVHDLSATGVLAVGSNYLVAENQSAIYVWLNQSSSSTTYAPSVAAGTPSFLAAGLGLGAIALVGVPLVMWWSRIRARRVAEERRITL